jgi:3-hydroxyisobutyrate dehydrogenase-like beta-hydroxyacid dehydrogenase
MPAKDVNLLLGEAESLGVEPVFARAFANQLDRAQASGLGRKDWSAALRLVLDRTPRPQPLT